MSQSDNKAIQTLVEEMLRAIDSKIRPLEVRISELEREVKTLKNK